MLQALEREREREREMARGSLGLKYSLVVLTCTTYCASLGHCNKSAVMIVARQTLPLK